MQRIAKFEKVSFEQFKNSLGKTGSGFHFHSLSFTAVVGELHLDVALVVGSVVIAVDDPDGIV